MNSPAFLKIQNLRAAAAGCERRGLPLVLSAIDREAFPPVNFPLPYLPSQITEDPPGYALAETVVVSDGSANSPVESKSWRQLCAWFESYPDDAYAIIGNCSSAGVQFVARFTAQAAQRCA